MRDVLVRAGSSLLAAAIGYIFLSLFVEGFGIPLKLVVAIALGAVAFAVAAWAGGADRKGTRPSVNVASNLKGASARIEDVRARLGPDQDTTVASNIHTDGPIEIKGASVDSATEGKK